MQVKPRAEDVLDLFLNAQESAIKTFLKMTQFKQGLLVKQHEVFA